jgi:short subunit dehydrogenase-like uncharacterized protein
MPDVVLFGATGYTGRLTAHSLVRRGADVAICGRDEDKLRRLSHETGIEDVRVADATQPAHLVDALDGARVLVSCVGPFVQHGWTAVEAALKARVHYVDSTGEGTFIQELIDRCATSAADAGIAMAPAMGFDEVPSNIAATLAVEGMERPDLVVTYAFPTEASPGTIASSLGILATPSSFIEGGEAVEVGFGERERWAPMPPPLGPRASVSAPLALGRLAPLQYDLESFGTYVTVDTAPRLGLKFFGPLLRGALSSPLRGPIGAVADKVVKSPDPERSRERHWTILAEARTEETWRNVALAGADMYGLTAELLAVAAQTMASDGYGGRGVMTPVQAVGLDTLRTALEEAGVSVEIFEAQ